MTSVLVRGEEGSPAIRAANSLRMPLLASGTAPGNRNLGKTGLWNEKAVAWVQLH